jgi:benzoyl-CoA reductase/2-hydroxyglutaryl-CoA dehydratase subunit BcrC/BadD/HgdB
LDIVHAGYFLDKQQFLTYLQDLLVELQQKQGTPVIKDMNDTRIFLSGSIIPPGDKKLITIIESLGGRIVGDDLWSGFNQFTKVDIKEPTIKGIADAYSHRVLHAALPYLELETDGRLNNLFRLIKDFKAQAVIYHTLRYCDPFTYKANETKDILKKIGIPLLEIHTEYAGSDFEAIRTRVEAFLELVNNKNVPSGV